jgi:hypothetical protein
VANYTITIVTIVWAVLVFLFLRWRKPETWRWILLVLLGPFIGLAVRQFIVKP